MRRLENKVVLITGAASGMGRATALLFAQEGGKILATDVNRERLGSLEKEIRKAGGEVTALIADMSKEADIEMMIAAAVKQYGTLDILVNNAGVMDNFAPVADLDDKTWDRVMNINVTGPMKAMRLALKIMLEKDSGIIINIASIGGLHGGRAGAAYTASKHALVGLTKNTGYMYGKTGIRCNAIAPGGVATNISEGIDMEHLPVIVNERIMPGMALNPRFGSSEEIAKAALFLATDESAFINGTVLVADGGWSAY
ncbi:MAG: glucose 1-dehydrogenase [Candidatus Marinimicrobia bacterium]|nr:glucose 1-dehydrogenase [Candidatus Neomarinimicrobiota bacterium]